jgi:hypothetical protein
VLCCAQVFNVPGRCFPVDIIHAREDHLKDYLEAAVDTVMQIHTSQPEGEPCSLCRCQRPCGQHLHTYTLRWYIPKPAISLAIPQGAPSTPGHPLPFA